MNVHQRFMFVVLLGLAAAVAYGQTEEQLKRVERGKEAVRPEETVSFRADVSYGVAIKSLSELSKKLVNRIIVDSSPLRDSEKQIGINIDAMYWKDALEYILRSNQLWYTEYPEYFEIMTIDDLSRRRSEEAAQAKPKEEVKQPPTGIPTPVTQLPTQTAVQQAPVKVDSAEIYMKTPEITISSIFVELNQSKIRESGMSLSLFRGRDLNLGIEFQGSSLVTSPLFGASVQPTGNRIAVDINSALRMIESENLGEVISRPQITVRSGSSGRMQIGQKFSLNTRDFAGNVVQTFFDVGTILTVKPVVYRVGDVTFIDISMTVEKSSVTPSATSTIINTTNSSTRLSLLNGEESYVGGLYSNEQSVVRQGIPFLKDLPWWFFGLRYLFGYDNTTVTKKELLVILKAEISPLIEDRLEQRASAKSVQQQRLEEMRKDYEKRTTIKK